MIELMANINTYVNLKTNNPSRNINEDFFASDTSEEVICRHDVSPLKTKVYLSGNYWAGFNFSYYCQSASVITARQTLDSIETVLNLDNFTDLLGLTDGRLIVTARPTPVSKRDDGTVVYTSSFQLVYFQEDI